MWDFSFFFELSLSTFHIPDTVKQRPQFPLWKNWTSSLTGVSKFFWPYLRTLSGGADKFAFTQCLQHTICLSHTSEIMLLPLHFIGMTILPVMFIQKSDDSSCYNHVIQIETPFLPFSFFSYEAMWHGDLLKIHIACHQLSGHQIGLCNQCSSA